ncbi:DUF4363 family protein [Clostridium sp. CX1]|uniref:DUF4363 family protein n=1 Tax=Clostridium tanneri TaxID=3037988 RepID=A0ABU4JQI6_9CLOT|nr:MULTISPECIES: DUF4363 family protein [unclassified Clostridium]MCT8977652.1 DUF4363 family protein [Clostridium sp. CX1]MDW8800385.1 DUF4363 family protein [Clostridium sp. A1-XYC3]
MKKLLYYGIPITVILVFILVMKSGNYLKQPRSTKDDVVMYIKEVTDDIRVDNWSKAEEDTKKLSEAWKMVMPRIQFSVERDEMSNISINIARLKGIVMGRDKSAAFTELSELYENWAELTR